MYFCKIIVHIFECFVATLHVLILCYCMHIKLTIVYVFTSYIYANKIFVIANTYFEFESNDVVVIGKHFF